MTEQRADQARRVRRGDAAPRNSQNLEHRLRHVGVGQALAGDLDGPQERRSGHGVELRTDWEPRVGV